MAGQHGGALRGAGLEELDDAIRAEGGVATLVPLDVKDIARPGVMKNASVSVKPGLQQINGVPGAAYISSTSSNTGQSTIQVYFDDDTDINIDQVNVQNRVSLAMPQLPQQVQSTGVSVSQSTPSILLAYQVSSSQGQFDAPFLNGLIYQNLYYQLGRVPGVANVNLLGGSNPAFWLFVDPVKLSANNLTADQVVSAVRSQNTVAIGGIVRSTLTDAITKAAQMFPGNGARLELAYALADILEYRVDLSRDLQRPGFVLAHECDGLKPAAQEFSKRLRL